MPYCEKCGVELEESAIACPLCGTRVAGAGGPAEQDASAREAAQEGEARRKRFLIVEVLSVVAGIAAALCLGIDLFSSKGRLLWSPYAIIGLAMIWLVLAMPRIFARRLWLVFAVLAPGELLLLFLVDVFDMAKGGADWFLSYGLPIYLLSLVILAAAVVLSLISKRRGLNILGIALACAAFECLGLETILSLASGGGVRLDWSPIVALACVPASGLAFYFHYRVIKKSLARTFHL
jgi:cytochrome c oxidase subunit IV